MINRGKKKRREKIPTIYIRNAGGYIITEPIDIKRIIRKHYEGVMSINLTTWMKWISFLKSHKLPKPTQEEINLTGELSLSTSR